MKSIFFMAWKSEAVWRYQLLHAIFVGLEPAWPPTTGGHFNAALAQNMYRRLPLGTPMGSSYLCQYRSALIVFLFFVAFSKITIFISPTFLQCIDQSYVAVRRNNTFHICQFLLLLRRLFLQPLLRPSETHRNTCLRLEALYASTAALPTCSGRRTFQDYSYPNRRPPFSTSGVELLPSPLSLQYKVTISFAVLRQSPAMRSPSPPCCCEVIIDDVKDPILLNYYTCGVVILP